VRIFGDVRWLTGKGHIEAEITASEDAQADVPRAWAKTPQGWKFVPGSPRLSRRERGFQGAAARTTAPDGGGRYTATAISGQLYACFVRSDRAHADILSQQKKMH